MSAEVEDLQDFFTRYGEALATGDLPGISGCYEVPALILADAGSVPVSAREEIEAAFDGAAERHREQGLVAARPTIISSERLSERLTAVDVRWDYLDERGESAERDGYRYVLRSSDESLRIQIVVARPELEEAGDA